MVLSYGYWNCSAAMKTKARILLESLWDNTSGNKAIALGTYSGQYVKLLGSQNTSSTMPKLNGSKEYLAKGLVPKLMH